MSKYGNQQEGQIGEVTEADEKMLTVKVERHAGCKGCNACDLGFESNKEAHLELKNSVNARVGDKVELDMAGSDILKASVLLYLFPLLALLGGVLAGGSLASGINVDKNLLAVILGFACMLAAFGVVKIYDRKTEQTYKFKPEIVRKISE